MTSEQLNAIEARATSNAKPSDGIQFFIHAQGDVLALVAEVRRLREALAPFQSGEWGKVKAWIVAGAPTEEEGIKAAKHLTHLNVMADNALNGGAS